MVELPLVRISLEKFPFNSLLLGVSIFLVGEELRSGRKHTQAMRILKDVDLWVQVKVFHARFNLKSWTELWVLRICIVLRQLNSPFPCFVIAAPVVKGSFFLGLQAVRDGLGCHEAIALPDLCLG